MIIGIPVALLQESGIFNGDTYLIRKDIDLTRDLKDFTICTWLSLNYLRGEKNYWISIGNKANERILVGSKFLQCSFASLLTYFTAVFDNGPNGPRIQMQKYHPRIVDQITIKVDRFDFQNYHHYCFLFTSQAQFPYPGGYVNLTNRAYVDGNLVNEEMKTVIKSNYEEIPRYVDLILGQRYRNDKSDFIPEESFSGRYAELMIYKEALSEDSIQSLSNCEVIINRNMVVDWFISSYEPYGAVSIEDVAKPNLCRKSPLANHALFNHGATHDYVKFICEKLGGQLPTLGKNSSERQSIYQSLKRIFGSSASNSNCVVSEDLNTDIEGRDMIIKTQINVLVLFTLKLSHD